MIESYCSHVVRDWDLSTELCKAISQLGFTGEDVCCYSGRIRSIDAADECSMRFWPTELLTRMRRTNTAYVRNNAVVAREFMDHGADVYLTIGKGCNAGYFALILAVSRGHIGIVRLLLENGADANARTKRDRCSVLLQAMSVWFFVNVKGKVEIVQLLLAHGADVNTANNNGNRGDVLDQLVGHVQVVGIELQTRRMDVHFFT